MTFEVEWQNQQYKSPRDILTNIMTDLLHQISEYLNKCWKGFYWHLKNVNYLHFLRIADVI